MYRDGEDRSPYVRLVSLSPPSSDKKLTSIVCPFELSRSIIRFAAGRISYTESEQAMCFLAGANAIFTVRFPFFPRVFLLPFLAANTFDTQGERMLTTPTSGWDDDKAMLGRWGLKGMGSFESATVRSKETKEAMAGTEERKRAVEIKV